jgi:hypothetical protein
MRQAIMAMDRKRRLTGSAYEGERRRHTPTEFYTRQGPQRSDQAASAAALSLRQSMSNNTGPPREVVDLTRSSSPPSSPEVAPRASRNSSSSSRRYVVPRWQPDAEVTECPICNRPFTWLFRRHHCRKCGRVVCNECSPHRITIPRQFIVNPPGLEMPGSATTVVGQQSETIDLTGDDDDSRDTRRRRSSTAMILDGGEKVRLCNPCVPDPQPDPQPNFPPIEQDDRPQHGFGPRFGPGHYPGQSFSSSSFGNTMQHSRFGAVSSHVFILSLD